MSLVKDLRQMLMQSFVSLPLLIIGWIFFMGVTQGNIAFLILALGHIFVVPLVTMLSNITFEFLTSQFKKFNMGDMSPFLTVPNADVCNLIPGSMDSAVPLAWVAPSYWMSHIVFFSVFLLTNAAYVYSMPAAEEADKEKVKRRETQVLISSFLTTLVFGLFIVMRYFLTGCETIPGILIALPMFGSLAFGWYHLVRSCSIKDSDVFGIVQGIKPESMKDDPPMTCVYQN